MSSDDPRKDMIDFVTTATQRPERIESNTPWPFQIQASQSEIRTTLGEMDSSVHKHDAMTLLSHNPSTIAMLDLFKGAVQQPEFFDAGGGRRMMKTDAFHHGADGLRYLKDSFGPQDAKAYLLERVPGLEATVPEFTAYLNDPKKGLFFGKRKMIEPGSPDFHEEARPLAADEGLRRLGKRLNVFLTCNLMTRAVHLSPERMIGIIEKVAASDLRYVHATFTDMLNQNTRRLGDRSGIRTLVRSGRIAVDKAYGIPRKTKVKVSEGLSA
ncbi:MAG: hypothetical protein K2X45_13065 [Phreatobacter sp.]|nr:hypothetical protein [Phreatobacter sp.]